jgi:ubiquinone/menaquinone biosynthesis C-methylase UbiE
MMRAGWRRSVLPGLRGDVLDLGAGTGAALPHLTATRSVSCVEPRPSRALRTAADRYGARLDAARAESLPYEDDSFDVAICSAVLCSVSDQDTALRELHRVLRPGGSVTFFEHIASAPGTWSRRAQRLIAPFSRVLDGGCDPARDTIEALQRSPFKITRLDREVVRGLFGFETVLISGRVVAEQPVPR